MLALQKGALCVRNPQVPALARVAEVLVGTCARDGHEQGLRQPCWRRAVSGDVKQVWVLAPDDHHAALGA